MYSTNDKTMTSFQATKVRISLGAAVLLRSHQGEAEARVGLEDLHATPCGLPVLVVGVAELGRGVGQRKLQQAGRGLREGNVSGIRSTGLSRKSGRSFS